jgi:WD40 repeat protein
VVTAGPFTKGYLLVIDGLIKLGGLVRWLSAGGQFSGRQPDDPPINNYLPNSVLHFAFDVYPSYTSPGVPSKLAAVRPAPIPRARLAAQDRLVDMPSKRTVSDNDNFAPPAKRQAIQQGQSSLSTTLATVDLLSTLSDELLVRILSFLPLKTLLGIAPVSRRFYRLTDDLQLWRNLYYVRFVLPRAMRIPGLRHGPGMRYFAPQAAQRDGGRNQLEELGRLPSQASSQSQVDWKRQYKIRHNWSRGSCAVEEVSVGDSPSPGISTRKTLVRVAVGVAVTADFSAGLRVWDIKTRKLLAQASLSDAGSQSVPSSLVLDDQGISSKILDACVGFNDGSFAIWSCDTASKQIVSLYRHERSTSGTLVGVAFSYPYVLTATDKLLLSLYKFAQVNPRRSPGGIDTAGKTLPAPFLLASLKSHTPRAPLALSIRKTANSVIASIAYTFAARQGWSIGVQDLILRPTDSVNGLGEYKLTSRIAYTAPIASGTPAYDSNRRQHHPRETPSFVTEVDMMTESSLDPRASPISLSYSHPYLLATLSDNTLILYLCTSDTKSLSLSPGTRLWGHTSGISGAEITPRGRAVSVSHRGDELRVWELEGRVSGKSVEIRPRDILEATENAKTSTDLRTNLDDHRKWVGFDDETVIVLKETVTGRQALMVYDFT